MIYCNGSPKTGTHLLLKTLFLFGGEYKLSIHTHTPYANMVGDAMYINIFRSPRNIIGSWLKFTKQDTTEANMIKAIPERIQEMFGYTEWYTKKDKDNFLNVKFEELLTDVKTINDISAFLGVPKKENHFKDIWGGGPTFTGSPFIWRDHWSDAIELTWVQNGGLILESTLEYDPHKVWTRKKP